MAGLHVCCVIHGPSTVQTMIPVVMYVDVKVTVIGSVRTFQGKRLDLLESLWVITHQPMKTRQNVVLHGLNLIGNMEIIHFKLLAFGIKTRFAFLNACEQQQQCRLQ